jgi:FkbM family methyltransferase
MSHSISEIIETVLELFPNKNDGYFVDIGAYDGVSISNTMFLEELGWSGICIEPHPKVFERLISNRNCRCVNCALWYEDTTVDFLSLTGYTEMLSGIKQSYDERHYNRILSELNSYGGHKEIIKIEAKKFDKLDINKKIDFLSIDTEGSELEILSTIDFNLYEIKVICIENNFYEQRFSDFFTERNYKLYKNVNIDYFFVKNDFVL